MLNVLLSVIENEEDRTDFTDLYFEYKQLLFKTAYDSLYDKSLAEDCVQNTFLNLIKYFDTFRRVTPENRKAYILCCCRYAAAKLNKEKIHEIYYDEVYTEPTTADSREYTETDKAVISEALDNLDEKYRKPFIMKYVYGFTVDEISDILGLSQNNAKQRLFRSRKMLCELLKEDENDT